MCAEDFDREELEDTLLDIAREVGRSVERAIERIDVEELAGTVGVDPDRAREWVGTASGWVRVQVERLGREVAAHAAGHERSAPAPPAGARPEHSGTPGPDPWRGAEPHPLDVPTDEQGLALAALESGRWRVEPGTDRLAARGEGPAPNDALGLARELRSRDWINTEGELTLAGRRALRRWLDSR